MESAPFPSPPRILCDENTEVIKSPLFCLSLMQKNGHGTPTLITLSLCHAVFFSHLREPPVIHVYLSTVLMA